MSFVHVITLFVHLRMLFLCYILLQNPRSPVMKKKIGLVELFIDEWHSNHLPEWIAKAARKDEFELFCEER